MVLYYCPLRPGAWKSFSTPDDSFWCCVGTGMENHTKYGDTIYFHDDRSLLVNLFIPSEVTWAEKGLAVRQETRFPEEDTTHLTMTAKPPVRVALKVRYPGWARSGMTVTVNGQRAPIQATPGSYVTIDREWKSGDRVDVQLPMSLHTEAMPDDPKMIAVMYGPIVLAGDLGREGLDDHQAVRAERPTGRPREDAGHSGAGRRRRVGDVEDRARGRLAAALHDERARAAARGDAHPVLSGRRPALHGVLDRRVAGGMGSAQGRDGRRRRAPQGVRHAHDRRGRRRRRAERARARVRGRQRHRRLLRGPAHARSARRLVQL